MNGLIVIEGPDCTGKTTLCDHLLKTQIPPPLYIHATYPYEGTTDVREYHMRLLRQAMKASETRLVILDRLWPSEIVYGNVYRNGPQHPGYETMLDRLVRRVAGIYVFSMYGTMDQYLEFVKTKLREGRNEFYTEKMGLTYDWYDGIIKSMSDRPDVLVYKWGGHHGEQMDDFKSRLLHQLVLHRAAQLNPCLDDKNQNFVGHNTMAKVLFVGDAPNVSEGADRFPFISFKGCSRYMALQLDEAGILDWETAFCNASEEGCDQIVDSFIKRETPVVVMGENAWKQLKLRWMSCSYMAPRRKTGVADDGCARYRSAVGGPLWRIAHPQYYNRFWNAEDLLAMRLNTIKITEKI